MATMDSTPGPGPAHHPSLPASPTLTNPDMILPDYPDYDRSPSPVLLDSNHPESPLTMWKNAQAGVASMNMSNIMYAQPDQSFHGFSSMTTETPIIYGNGTMLSDIGEVTEAESMPARPSPPRSRQSAFRVSPYGTKATDSEVDAALRSSPTMGKSSSLSGIKKKAREQAAQRERRDSAGSDSTITGDHERPNLFADVNDAASVGGDSVFQGDDEESLASSYIDDSDVHGPSDIGGPLSASLPPVLRQKYSATQLSLRAEHILANAKRRLTTMEDNLTRARSGLTVTSYTSGSNASTPSPPIARATSALLAATSSTSSPAVPGHNRMGSDNSLRIGLPIKVYPQRSSSSLGVSNAPHQPLAGSRSADQLNGQFDRTSYIVRENQVALDPLGEDSATPGPYRGDMDLGHRHSTRTSTSFSPDPERGLARSASATHIRDIKDQVKDLKGKISSLREQARADSLKRTSLQSLRTPSPFTHAQIDQWYAGSGSGARGSKHEISAEDSAHLGDDTASIGKDSAVNIGSDGFGNGEDEMVPSEYGDGDEGMADATYGDYRDYESPDSLREDGFVDVKDEDDDIYTDNGDVTDEDAGFSDAYDSMSESGESLYHEASQEQLSHEDREDAFDYEHFFLHSAMGTMSQRAGCRDSVTSYSSEGSVETTRGPLAEDDSSRARNRKRRGSEASLSTVESFATAEEGGRRSMDSRRSEDNEVVEDTPEQHDYTDITYSEIPESPQAAEQVTSAGIGSAHYASMDRPSAEVHGRQESMHSAMRRPMSRTVATRPCRGPSVSSLESTGTTRSFPLVNRTSKTFSTGILTPDGGSPNQAAKSASTSTPSETTDASRGMQDGDMAKPGAAVKSAHEHTISLNSINSAASLIQESGTTAVLETLARDDQFLVERLVASLGRCVLGLAESGRASAEGRMYRRKIDAARRILEGLEQM